MQKHLFRYPWLGAMLIVIALVCIGFILYALFCGDAQTAQIPTDAYFVKGAVSRASL